MRLLELNLMAFGAFEGQTLDLSAEGPVVHVVYGPNEAGKSTALRAITGLLYGIPERTKDAFSHKPSALRIGGRIEHAGDELSFVRRKGRKNTLLDVAGEAIDEAPLLRALGGVSRELFLTMFGLDHRTLRDGAEALLRGEGGVGESLFDAGGAQGIGAVLAGLREEADEIYKSRGQNQPLAEAFRAYKEAKATIVTRDVEPKAWLAQQQAVKETSARRDELAKKRRRLIDERHRLGRALRVLPIFAERGGVVERLAELGDAPRLPDDATERRLDATKVRDEGKRDAARLGDELAKLIAQRDALEIDEALLTLDDEQIARVKALLNRDRTAAADRPKLEVKRREQERQALAELRELGHEVGLDEVEDLRIDKATEARLTGLADEHAGHHEALEGIERRHREAEARLAQARAALASLPEPVERGALEAAVERARRAGDLDARVAKSEPRARRLRAQLQDAVEALPRFSGSVSDAVQLSLPTTTEVREAAGHSKERARRRADLERRRSELVEAGAKARRDLEALEAQGDVPTEGDLERARALRDRLGEDLARAIADKRGRDELQAYREGVSGSDVLADRLRHEADRVARRGQLVAERVAAERLESELRQELNALSAEDEAAREAWRASWPGVDTGEPEVMLEWLDDHRALVELAAREREATEELEATEAERAVLVEVLSEALDALGEDTREGASLAPLLDRAASLLKRLGERAAERAALGDRLAEQQKALVVLESEREQKLAAMARWRKDWGRAVGRLRLAPDARVDEVRAVLSGLRDAFEHLKDARSTASRIEGMDRDASELAAVCRPLVERLAVDLVDRPIDEAVAELLARHARTTKVAGQREELDARIAEKREELVEVERQAGEASAELEQLARAAGVDGPDEIEGAEAKAEERRELERRRQALDEQLFTEGLALDTLRTQVEGVDMVEARERLDEIQVEEEELNEQISDLDRRLATQQHGIELMRQRQGAFGAADDREALVAGIRRLASRWATLRLAAVVLEREIERYRERNEGPVIRRASAIFPKLTLGEYRGVRASYDERDEPELRCIGVDDEDVPVQGLSDGTRDQLYLALRLASLERHAEQADLMPFVADDILVHFDEDRARAALSVLSDFAATTQVLMFTHQARHVELAREAVDAERLVVHELEGGRRKAKAG